MGRDVSKIRSHIFGLGSKPKLELDFLLCVHTLSWNNSPQLKTPAEQEQ